MKIRSIARNNRKNSFEVTIGSRVLAFPYARCDPAPSKEDPISRVFVDRELGNEGFTYVLDSGREGTVHAEQVLEYNQDPRQMRDRLLYRLTLEAQKGLEDSPLSRREIIRRLETSATQFYRLIDQKNYRKSIDQLLTLLNILDREVDLVVYRKRPSRRKAA